MLGFRATKVAKKTLIVLIYIYIFRWIWISGYLDEVIRPLVLILPKMSGYVQTFKVKEREKGKNSNLIYFRINNEKLSEKYKTIGLRLKTY